MTTRGLPSQPILQQIPQVFTNFNSLNMNLSLETFKLDENREMCQIKPKKECRDQCYKMASIKTNGDDDKLPLIMICSKTTTKEFKRA
jgi:hypothetical protein